MNAGFYSTLPSNCYHQIVHSSFDLNIYYTHHINGEYAVIKRLIRKRLEKPLIQLIRRVFDYLPNKYITVDDKDPEWMNEIIKSKIKIKNKLYKQYIQGK